MKKLKLRAIELGASEILSRDKMKLILGGDGSSGSGGSGSSGDDDCYLKKYFYSGSSYCCIADAYIKFPDGTCGWECEQTTIVPQPCGYV